MIDYMPVELVFFLPALAGFALGAAWRGWPEKRFTRVCLQVAAVSFLIAGFMQLILDRLGS